MITVIFAVAAAVNPCAWSKTHPIYDAETRGCVTEDYQEKPESETEGSIDTLEERLESGELTESDADRSW